MAVKTPINIWDDYYEDGHVPEGKTQETYLYVDTASKLSRQRKVIERIKNCLEFYNPPIAKTKFKIQKFDSRRAFNLPDGCSHLHFRRWELRFVNLSHQDRELLVEWLNSKFQDLEFYSES